MVQVTAVSIERGAAARRHLATVARLLGPELCERTGLELINHLPHVSIHME